MTDVCVLFPTLSALAEGFEVYVVVDASGTFNEVVRDAALTRASAAGAVLINWFAVACELQKDWRLGPNAGQVGNVTTAACSGFCSPSSCAYSGLNRPFVGTSEACRAACLPAQRCC